MRILLFMDVYIFGGCEKMLKETSEYLLAKGNDVDLLLIYKSENNTYLKMLDPRIKIKYIWDIDSRSYLAKRMVYWINVLFPKIASAHVDINEYDMIINFKDDYQTNIISSKFKCKKISWVHNITEEYSGIDKKGIKYRLAELVYKEVDKKYINTFSRFDTVVFVSEHAKDALEKKLLKTINSMVIYNYVNVPLISELAEEAVADYSFNKFTFCYVGRLSAEKGVMEIVEAFCRLVQNGCDANLIVLGEGYQLEELKRLAVEKKCQSNICFLGTKENPYPYIKKSDVILCASYKESFGLVVLESIILNKWIISTKCGGPEELIEDGVNGYLVGDYQKLYEKMKELYKKQDMRVKKSSILDYKNLKSIFGEKMNLLINDKEGF